MQRDNRPVQAPPAEPVTQEHHLDPKKGLFRGLFIGVFGPLITVPIDKIQANVVVNPSIKFNSFSTFFKNPEIITLMKHPLKGYTFIAGANIPRTTVAFAASPIITNQLKALNLDHKTSEVLGYVAAGVLEGLVSGPITVIRQKLFTTEMKSAREVLFSLSMKDLASRSLLSTHYLMLRNGTSWPIYRTVVQAVENYSPYDMDNKFYQNQLKQFVIGAGAGALATIPSQPFDAMMKRRLHEPEKSAWKLISESAKESGWRNIYKLFYRGYAVSLTRVPLGMGATNIGMHLADTIYDSYHLSRKLSTQTAVNNADVTPSISSSIDALFKPAQTTIPQDTTNNIASSINKSAKK